MNVDEPLLPELDARLRRLHAGLDTRAGFEARLAARIAALPQAPRADLRAQFERRREREARGLRREAWMNGLTVAGVGVAALALYSHYIPDIARLAAAPLSDSVLNWLVSGTVAVLVAVVWPLLNRPSAGR